jgi:hypothetical protein
MNGNVGMSGKLKVKHVHGTPLWRRIVAALQRKIA